MKKNYYFNKIVILSFLILIVLTAISLIYFRFPYGVKRYKNIFLGMHAFENAGDSTGWAPPDDVVPKSDFYVYSLGDESFCIGSDCGIGGYFTECLGGWISGYRQMTSLEDDYGLSDFAVKEGKERVIMIADNDAKIVGIYPGARIKNLPYILKNHRNIIPKNTFETCYNMLPQYLK